MRIRFRLPPNPFPNTQQDPSHVETPRRRLEEGRPARLLQRLGLLHHRGRTRFQPAREKAVADQIARLTSDGPEVAQPQEVVEVRTSPAIHGARITTNGADTYPANRAVFHDAPSPRPATASQVRAIRAICARRKIDLLSLLRERFGFSTADELGIRQASNLIDELKGDEGTASPGTNGHTNGNGNGAYAATGGAR